MTSAGRTALEASDTLPAPHHRLNSLGLSGGNLVLGGPKTVQLLSEFVNGSCLIIWLSDHFLDGWDIG